jgi:dihydrofolate synthase/folylpolyglutamate synthase
MMDYKWAISYLEGLERFGIQLGLQNISFLLSRLGNPHKRLNTVLVGGTNGKGSVATFLANILREKGIKVGLYTSPHLLTLRERMVVNGEPIQEERLRELVSSIRPYVDECSRVVSHPTYFEVLTAICLLYFKEEEVDLGVLEVGLGGRLDATNAADPLIAVITNVGLDHTDRLGSTLRDIADEIAGIIKEGGRVITGEREGDGLDVIKGRCRERRASLWQIDEAMGIEPHNANTEGQNFTLKGLSGLYPSLRIRLLGSYQMRNAALSVGAAELLGGIKEAEIRKGLEKTRWPGRIEVAGKEPWLILDGAHNPPAAEVLSRELVNIFPFKRIIFILGILKDKDVRGIVEGLLLPFTRKEHFVIVTQPRTHRALPKEILAYEVARITPRLHTAKDLPSSIESARDMATREDLICVSGSLYTVADAEMALGRKVCLVFD